MNSELHPKLVNFIDQQFKACERTIRAGDEVIPTVVFFIRVMDNYTFIPLLGAASFFVSDDAKRLLRAAIRERYADLQQSISDVELIAIIQVSDVYVENVEGVQFENGSRLMPFVPKAGEAEALMVHVTLENGEYVHEWKYVRSGGDVVFAVQRTITESLHIPGQTRISGLWPL